MNKYREKYLETLTQSACKIIEKVGSGVPLSEAECICLRMYQREMYKQERVPPHTQLQKGLKTFQKFLGNILPTTTLSGEVDDDGNE